MLRLQWATTAIGGVVVRLRPEEGDFDVDPSTTTHKNTVKGSDAQLKKLRSKPKSGLHMARMVLCNSSLSRTSTGPSPRTKRHGAQRTAMSSVPMVEHMQSVVHSVCGQSEMDKLIEDTCFDTIAPGIVVASKVEEDRRVVQLVSNLCASVCGEYLITGWEFRWSLPGDFLHFGGRGCGCASTRAVDDQALVGNSHEIGEGLARERGHNTLPSSGDLAFTAMVSRDLLTIVQNKGQTVSTRGGQVDSGPPSGSQARSRSRTQSVTARGLQNKVLR